MSSEPSSADKILRQLFAARGQPRDTHVQLKVQDILWLCQEAIEVLKVDPILLELEAPIAVCGDLHGQFFDLLEFINSSGKPPETKYLFLGDYVDRGRHSIETFTILLAMKVRYPDSVYLLRGNHETEDISRLYGFFAECASRYNQALWERFNEVFLYLPLAAVISKRIFCVHGGLSPKLENLDQIRAIKRPLVIPEHGMLADLLWADPSNEHQGFVESERGTSYTFGSDAARAFLDANDFDLVCRAHQVVCYGFDFPFEGREVLTVFSAPDYCDEFGNTGAILKVDENLKCTFDFVAPIPRSQRVSFRPPTPQK